MVPQMPLREPERANYEFFLDLPEVDRTADPRIDVKGSQFLQPLFEYSGACAGCGETPYVKLLSQLFGDRALIANATGCSSIYGGNLPTTPWAKDADGRGPAWSNSLFEDNAEFGFGFRLAVDSRTAVRDRAVKELAEPIGRTRGRAARRVQRTRRTSPRSVSASRLKKSKLAGIDDSPRPILLTAGRLPGPKSVWASAATAGPTTSATAVSTTSWPRADVNVLVLDTEVYSNTGGQMPPRPPRSAPRPSSPPAASRSPRRTSASWP
jgi:pyruvate-ferredoxin/flavodoxin oxidoreductase